MNYQPQLLHATFCLPAVTKRYHVFVLSSFSYFLFSTMRLQSGVPSTPLNRLVHPTLAKNAGSESTLL